MEILNATEIAATLTALILPLAMMQVMFLVEKKKIASTVNSIVTLLIILAIYYLQPLPAIYTFFAVWFSATVFITTLFTLTEPNKTRDIHRFS